MTSHARQATDALTRALMTMSETKGLYGHWIEPAPSLLDDPIYIKRRDELRAWLAGNGPQPKPIPITRLNDNPAAYCSTCDAELWFPPSQARGICEKCWRRQQVTT